MANLYDELAWRGLVHTATEELPELLAKERVTAYIGFDPTASSLHVGSLLTVMGLARLQRFGHTPIALVGGGTGMIGDPSGKSQERQLLSREQIEANVAGIKAQLSHFLDFEPVGQCGPARQQRRLARVLRPARLPARHREVFHRELHAAEGVGEPASRERGRHLVHRVQLHAAPGARFSGAVRPLPLHAADGRQRSVGQHHGRHRSDSEAARRQGARPGLAADEDGDGREVREDRSGHDLARSRADLAVPVLPVLAQHRRSRRRRVSEGTSRFSSAGRSRRSRRRRRRRPRSARRSACSRAR